MRTVPLTPLSFFTGSLAACYRAGLPHRQALKTAGRLLGRRVYASDILPALQRLDEGHTLSEALSQLGSHFPQFYLAALACGERSGRLEMVLDRLAHLFQMLAPAAEVVRKTWQYPVAIVLFGLAFRLGALAVFKRYALAGELLVQWAENLVIVGLLVTLIWKWPTGRRAFDWCKLQVPILGGAERSVCAVLFLQNLGTLYEAGSLGVVETLDLATATVPNLILRADLIRIGKQFREAPDFEELFRGIRWLPDYVLGPIFTGVQSGSLDQALDYATKQIGQKLEADLNVVNAFLWRIMAFSVTMSIAGTLSYCLAGLAP